MASFVYNPPKLLVSRKEQQGCSKAKLGLGWLGLKKGSLRGHGNSVQSTLKTLIAEP